MNDFVADRTGFKATGIERPSFMKSPLFPITLLSFLTVAAFVGYQLYYAEFMKNTVIWTVAIIFVYWFSVSGGMHNIIRGVPMQHWDRASGKVSSLAQICLVCTHIVLDLGCSTRLLLRPFLQPVFYPVIVLRRSFYSCNQAKDSLERRASSWAASTAQLGSAWPFLRRLRPKFSGKTARIKDMQRTSCLLRHSMHTARSGRSTLGKRVTCRAGTFNQVAMGEEECLLLGPGSALYLTYVWRTA